MPRTKQPEKGMERAEADISTKEYKELEALAQKEHRPIEFQVKKFIAEGMERAKISFPVEKETQ